MSPKRHLHAAALGLALSALAVGAVCVAGVATADPPHEGYAPDPPVIASTKHWVFTIHSKEGVVSLGAGARATSEKPEGTPRVLGRFAIELYCGKELLDRVRFNVPGMGDGPHSNDHRFLKKPAMDRVTTHFKVRIADNPRTTHAKFIDRATGQETLIAWPPDAPPADAGAPSASAAPTSAPAPSASATATAAPDAGPPKSRAER